MNRMTISQQPSANETRRGGWFTLGWFVSNQSLPTMTPVTGGRFRGQSCGSDSPVHFQDKCRGAPGVSGSRADLVRAAQHQMLARLVARVSWATWGLGLVLRP